MEQHKKDMGKMGEAVVIQQILENNCAVFLEFGDNSRTDMIIQSNSDLHRVQVKTVSRNKKDDNSTNLLLYKNGPGYRYTYSEQDTDWFAVVDSVTKKVAWIKSDVCNVRTTLTLRHTLPQKLKTGYHLFDDYTKFPF